MKRLSNRDLQSRREFDFQVVAQMCLLPWYAFTAHRTPHDAETGSKPIKCDKDARYATHYRAVFQIRTLVGAGRYSNMTIIRIDASASRYPLEPPSAWVVEQDGSSMPWSPHFARGLPICHGSIWRPDGQILLGHYLGHLARLLNWDEQLSDGYEGYNGKAVRWWKKHLDRPIDPNLRYPALPVELLYGKAVVRNSGEFRPSNSTAAKAPGGEFRPCDM